MVLIRMKYVVKYHRKEKDYWYFRFKGRHYPLPGGPGDGDFAARHKEYLQQFEIEPAPEPDAGSIEAVIREYLASPEYLQLAASSQRDYRRYFDYIRENAGEHQIGSVTRADALKLRDRFGKTPGKANNIVAKFSTLLTFARDRGYIDFNPCHGIKRLKGGEYQPWPAGILNNVLKETSPTLTLAIYLHLFTGQRISDVVKMTWNDIEKGLIRVKQKKTGKELWVPIHSSLALALSETPREAVTILANRYKRPFTPDALRERLRRLTNYHFHGLTKNAINALFEAGCTEYEVQAITGKSLDMIRHYAKGVNQKILAMEGIKKLERKGNGP